MLLTVGPSGRGSGCCSHGSGYLQPRRTFEPPEICGTFEEIDHWRVTKAMLPFTQNQLLDVFARYNQSITPMLVPAYLAGLAALWLVRDRKEGLQRAAWVILGALWLWTGTVFFFFYYSQIGPPGPFLGLPFMIEGGLCVFLGLNEGWATRPVANRDLRIGWVMAGSALLYPFAMLLMGHDYPSVPMFGVTPCPLVVFTFAIMLLSPLRVPTWMLWVPLAWSVIGGSAALLLQMPQDVLLPVSALALLASRYLTAHGRLSGVAAPAAPRGSLLKT